MYRKLAFALFYVLFGLNLFVQTADAYTVIHRYHLNWQSFYSILKLTPTPTTSPTQKPTPKISPTPTQNDPVKTFIMNAVNQYRKSQNLYAIQTNDLTCNFAKVRAKEITTNFSHDGFNERIISHTLPYPTYHLIAENIAENSDYKDVVNEWIKSPGHAENMRANTPYVCVEQDGNFYAYEGWNP